MPDRQRAQLELNEKLKLERGLFPSIRAYDRDVVRAFTRGVVETGESIDFHQFDHALESILLAHYESVGDRFGDTLDRQLPEDDRLRPEEAAALALVLGRAWRARAPAQAGRINETTNRNARSALAVARDSQAERLLEGLEPLTDLEVAATAGNVLDRDLAGRRTGIVTLETQAPAELAKQAELRVLLRAPAEGVVEEAAREVVKEWVSQGDSRVRDAHLAVDSTQVRVDRPFVVKGQRLMHPGDTSLGATLDNVVNCRCSAITPVESVSSARQDLLS